MCPKLDPQPELFWSSPALFPDPEISDEEHSLLFAEMLEEVKNDREVFALLEKLEQRFWGKSFWDLAVEATLEAYDGDDPNAELDIDPEARQAGVLFWGGVPFAAPRSLAPDWAPRYPQGFLLAEDLLTEGLELLLVGDVVPTLAKLECGLAILERMPQDREAVSAACVIVHLRESIDLLRGGRPLEARLRLAPLVKNGDAAAAALDRAA